MGWEARLSPKLDAALIIMLWTPYLRAQHMGCLLYVSTRRYRHKHSAFLTSCTKACNAG